MTTSTSQFNGINPIDQEALRAQVQVAKPVKNFMIDNFLDESFANEVHDCFPSFEEAKALGKNTAASINEQNKYQVTDSTSFKPPLLKLHEMLQSDGFCDLLANVFDIPNILSDPELVGGGNIELWDSNVKNCVHSFTPVFNRCVVFETNEISYHGVTAVKCPESMARRSFAGYYYTTDEPEWWEGNAHSTIFKARPDEKLKGSVLMPAEKISRLVRRAKRKILGS